MFRKAFEFWKIRDLFPTAIDEQIRVSVAFRPARGFGVEALPGFDQGRKDANGTAPRQRFRLGDGLGKRLTCDRLAAVGAMLRAEFGKKQTQEVIHFRDCRNGGLSASACDALLNGHCRWKALDAIDIRAFKLGCKLSRVGRHAVQKAALSLGKEEVKSE